jgi:sugar phosphate isomerase/epimerase
MSIEVVLFTKLFKGRPFTEVVELGSSLGFDGIDLLIRDGFHLTPGEPERIASAVTQLRSAGLSVPIATTDLTDPTWPAAGRLLAACAQSGIDLVRLGYWTYDPSVGYTAQLDDVRRDLDGLETLARSTGVRLLIQLHGETVHGSGAQTLALLKDHDPRYIGAYPDPGNQAVQDGREDWRFTFDVLSPWMACIGVKNGGWFPADVDGLGQRRWREEWLPLAEGMVPWADILGHLRESRFDGVLSFHSHYEYTFDRVIEQTRDDLRFVQGRLGAALPTAGDQDRALA